MTPPPGGESPSESPQRSVPRRVSGEVWVGRGRGEWGGVVMTRTLPPGGESPSESPQCSALCRVSGEGGEGWVGR